MNRYLYRLTRERRDLTERVLQRTEEHLPVVLEHLNRQGLPLELACLPMVESAFEPRAVSAAGAAGLWQLMPDTARRFGLVVKGGADERFDVAKSSAAAAAYLDWLYQKFGDWPLALAAYNCGEGSMQRALERSDSDSLSALTLSCRNAANPYLKEETLQFVPQFAAVVLTMSQSDKLGLRASPLLALGRTGGGYRDFSAAGRSRSSALRPQGPYGTDGPGGFGGPNGACDPPEPGGPQGVYASGERAGVRLSLVGDYSRAETPEAKPAQSRRISK